MILKLLLFFYIQPFLVRGMGKFKRVLDFSDPGK